MASYLHYGITSDLFTSGAGFGFAGAMLYSSPTEFGIRAPDGSMLYFTGTGLVWDAAQGKFTGGTITGISHYTNGNYTDQLSGLSLSATALETAFETGTTASLQAYLLSGNDTLDATWQAGNGTAGVSLNGYAGNDTLFGGAGNDTLIGGIGADSMKGGAGNDTYYVDNANDVVIETGSTGVDTIVSSISLSLADTVHVQGPVENLTITGTAYSAIGNELDNLITGNAQTNVLGGSGGNDTIYGMGGNDSFWGGLGDDKMYGGSGNDHFWGDAGNDLMDGGDGNDVMYGSAGNDTYIGGAGTDIAVYTRALADLKITVNGGTITIIEPHGVDTLIGIEQLATDEGVYVYDSTSGTWTLISSTPGELLLNPGSDIQGGSGADVINMTGTGKSIAMGNGGNDTITGSNGYELIKGGDGADVLYGDVSKTVGNIDRLFGDGGNDILYGRAGDDILYGGDGNDTLNGGNGNDELTGGTGADVFSFTWDGTAGAVEKWGNDTIRDFQIGVDHLHFDFMNLAAGTATNAVLTQTAAGALITLAGCGTILLEGVNASGHTLAEFLV